MHAWGTCTIDATLHLMPGREFAHIDILELEACIAFVVEGTSGRVLDGCDGSGKREKMGFREAFAEVHAANDEMQSLYVQLAASSASL